MLMMNQSQSKTPSLPGDYGELLRKIKERVRSAQYAALRMANREMIEMYWDIGRMIADRQEGDTWGKAIVKKLASDLQTEFPGTAGFSAQNLWKMRQFYEEYKHDVKLSPLVREIAWTHNMIIIMQCKDPLEREFYLRMTRRRGWSKDVLALQIENRAYEKTLLNQTNFEETLPEQYKNQAKLAIKDEYSLDFLEIGEEHGERQMERAILARIERFLREMGGRFAFMGSQYRLEIDGHEYFIDLLLYHRGLQCLFAVELKVGEFQPEFVGKMQFYLAALDDRVRTNDEKPSIGMILCRTKSRTIVEYALRESRKPIGVASYRIMKHLPEALARELPEPGQIEKLLMDVEKG